MKTYEASSFEEFEEFWDYDSHRELRERREDYQRSIQQLRPPRRQTPIEDIIAAQVTRALLAGNEGDLTVDEWLKWCRCFDGKCAYCQNDAGRAVIEHVLPVCSGGGTVLSNIVPACRRCNSAKGKRSVEAFLGKSLPAFMARVLAADARMRL